MAAGLNAVGVTKEFVVWNGFWGFLHPERRRVLHGVTAGFPRGAISGLSGANGAGKTTLLKVLAGLVIPTSGQVLLDGSPGPELGSAWRSRVAITIAESRSFYWRLTCRQNLDFFSALQGHDAALRKKRILEVAGRIGLTSFLDQRFYQLSSGQMQRMAIARALLADPEVWLLDEPERDLDADGVAALRDEMERFRSLGRCLLLVTHDEGTLRSICDPVFHMDHGAVVPPPDDSRSMS